MILVFDVQTWRLLVKQKSLLDEISLQPCKVGPLLLLGRFNPSLQGCNFWSKKDMKNLSTDLESAKAEKAEPKKSSFFPLHFSFSTKMLINQNILLKIIFPTVYNFLM